MDLSKLDPNLVLTLITLAGSLVTWLYKKAKGEKQADITDALWAALEGKAIALAESEETATVLREKLTKAAHEALARMGMKRNAIVDAVVAKLVERGVSEVRKRILAKKNAAKLEAQILATATQAAAVTGAFTPPANPTVPRLEMDVEIVQP